MVARPEQRRPAPVRVIAHRGASGHAPEHTFPAYDLALEIGCDYIEQDLQMTKDGHLVVLHDTRLDRTARPHPGANFEDWRTGLVRTKTLDEVKRCDVGSWFNAAFPEKASPEHEGQRVPTLEEVFRRYRHKDDVRFYIETKHPDANPGMEEELLRLMDTYDLTEPAIRERRVVVQSFVSRSLLRLRAMNPHVPLVQLLSSSETPLTIRDRIPEVASYAFAIGPWHEDVDEEVVGEAHEAGLEVHPYTVDDEKSLRRMVELGVDAVFTGHPDLLNALLLEAGDREAAARNAARNAARGDDPRREGKGTTTRERG